MKTKDINTSYTVIPSLMRNENSDRSELNTSHAFTSLHINIKLPLVQIHDSVIQLQSSSPKHSLIKAVLTRSLL